MIVMKHTNIDDRSDSDRLRDQERRAVREGAAGQLELPFEFPDTHAQSHRTVLEPGDGQRDNVLARS